MNETLRAHASLYRNTLLEDVIPFWERHSLDRECGGYLTCLYRDGRVYDTDKFVWLQARQVWMFSLLYNRVERRQAWLDIAAHGVAFLLAHALDAHGDWYFVLDRKGRPLVEAYNIFSDCFACMALAEYARAAKDGRFADTASRTYLRILERRGDPKGRFEKRVSGTRPLRSFGMSMILTNLTIELGDLLSRELCEKVVTGCSQEILRDFLNPKNGLIHEFVADDGSHPDTFEGRLLNPGHGIEGTWFLMELGRLQGDEALVRKAVDVLLRTLEYAWDRRFGGIFYFMDALDKPLQQLEWDQKLWWVHLEALIATLMGYSLAGSGECLEWYLKIHDYTWSRFPDPEFGEWFGYLDRRGEVLLPLKGGKWKGCFHLPRALHRCSVLLDTLTAGGEPSHENR